MLSLKSGKLRFPAFIRFSLAHPAVLPQATSSNVHSVWPTEIGTTDYAPTCGNRRRQGACGIRKVVWEGSGEIRTLSRLAWFASLSVPPEVPVRRIEQRSREIVY